MDNSSVSVVIPTYNRAGTLERAVDSVLEQTLDASEVIVVDDGSTDNTPELMSSYTDDRVEYIQFDENRGANAARNAGIKSSSGTYVSFLDSDDEFIPTHLETVLSALEASGEDAGGVYTSQRFKENGRAVDVTVANQSLRNPQTVAAGFNGIGFSSLTFRRVIFDEVGMFDESMDAFQDLEFLIRYLKQYELAPVSEILVNHYYHDEQRLDIADRISTDYAGKLDALNYLIEKHNDILSTNARAFINYTRGFLHANRGEMDAARREFVSAVRTNPTRAKYYIQLPASLLGESGFWLINDLKSTVRIRLSKIKNALHTGGQAQ